MKLYLHFFLIFCCVLNVSSQSSAVSEDDRAFDYTIQTDIDSLGNLNPKPSEHQIAIDEKRDILNDAFEAENPLAIHQGYHLLANEYLSNNDTLLARESFEKSKKFAKLSKNTAALALSYNDLAKFYATAQKNYNKAFQYSNKSIDLYKKINDTIGLSKAYHNDILMAFDDGKLRQVYATIIKARKLQPLNKITAFGIALDYLAGEYYSRKENYQLANDYFKKSIHEAESKGYTIELENAYGYYYKSLKKQNKLNEAFEALTIYETLKDKNRDDMNSAEISALAAKFQVAEYRKDVLLAERENNFKSELVESKSKLNRFLIIIAACFLILLFVLLLVLSKRKVLVDKLKERNKEYLNAKREAELLSKTKSKFFSTVSHELRTPLYGVIGLSTILLEDNTLKEHESDLKSLKFSADYLLALINDVLQLNKIDSKNLEDEHTDFNLEELIRKITSSFEYMRLQNKNEIHVHISESVPQNIHGNTVRLSQILMNLIGNACKFTENGNVYVIAETVRNTRDKTSVKFYIRDTGMGIPSEKQASIFEEFSQLHNTNSKYRGSGLGLPIVKKLLNLSNSEINLQSEVGKGSMFTFTLDFDIATGVQKTVVNGLLDLNLLRGKHILIVEDNRINQTVTKKILEKNKIICSIAENGLQAVELARKQLFDLILMDINMPIMNGMEASEEIRTFNKTIPIVALTAVEVEEMRLKIMDSGMNDIIVKPYDVTRFTQTILKNITSVETRSVDRSETRLRAV